MARKGEEGSSSLMHIFDKEIVDVKQLFDAQEKKELQITDNQIEDVGKNNMIFQNETAYELGGGLKQSLSFELPGSGILNEDRLFLVGKDLSELDEDSDFIRITILEVNEENINGDALYNELEKIKLRKYSVSPKGYMLRTAIGDKEKVRISKELKNSGSFVQIGSAYIKAYKQLPFVKYVQMYFVTGENEVYMDLKNISKKKNEIISTIDHMLKGMLLNDCNACSAKELCDEVTELRQIHQTLE